MNTHPHVHKLVLDYQDHDVFIKYGDQSYTLHLHESEGEPEAIVDQRISQIISEHDLSFDPYVVKIDSALSTLRQKYSNLRDDILVDLPRLP